MMVRADIVRARHPFFHEDRYFSDSDAAYEILRDSDFGFVHQILSFTRIEADSSWARSLDYDPLVLDRLIRLVSYGPLYLSAEENARLTSEHEHFYRRLLAEAWLRRREPGVLGVPPQGAEGHRPGHRPRPADARRRPRGAALPDAGVTGHVPAYHASGRTDE